MAKLNANFNKSEHEDSVDDEKQTEALHRALAAMAGATSPGIPHVAAGPSIAPPAPPAPAAPTQLSTAPVMPGMSRQAKFPGLAGVIGQRRFPGKKPF